ncbi:MAG: LytTR family DNA-binding domain-containing protein [Bacteroidota bacterium]
MNARLQKMQWRNWAWIPAIGIAWLLTMGQDLASSWRFGTGYFWSESLLFSLYWPLLLPVGVILIRRFATRPGSLLVLAVMSNLVHLVMWSLLIALVSHTMMRFPFALGRLLERALVDEFLWGMVLHVLLWHFLTNEKKHAGEARSYRSFLKLRDGKGEHLMEVDKVLFMKSDRPYLAVWTESGKYLISESLQSVAAQLDPACFVRVHRSTIVNLNKVVSYASRGNGDYDVRLSDESQIRLSRRYRDHFLHQLQSTQLRPAQS